MAEWLIGGRYPIAVALSERQLVEFGEAGVQFNVKGLEAGARSLSVSASGLHLFNRAPHPNAAKVFINWLLTQKVQQLVTESVASNSLRLDVPPGYPPEAVDPKRLEDYIPHQHEHLQEFKERTRALSEDLIK